MKTFSQETSSVDSSLLRAKTIEGLPFHDVIYSIVTGKDGKIYMGVSSEFGPGTYAHIFFYDPQTDQLEDLVDLEELLPEGKDSLRPPHSKIHTSMCVGPDGKIYAASHLTAPPRGEKFLRMWEILDDPRRCFTGSHVIVYDPQTRQVEDLGIVIPREGARFMTMNLDREELYMVSCLRAHFFVFRPRKGEIKDLGRISQAQCEALGPCWSRLGYAYTTDNDGFILRYDPEDESIERLPVRIPDAPWCDGRGNRARRMKVGPDGIKLYGFGTHGHLFEYDPGVGPYGRVRDFGVLCGEERFMDYSFLPPVKALAFGQDNKIYCAVGNVAVCPNNDPGPHIVSFDPDTGEVKDFGLMQAKGLPPVSDCQDATTGEDGTIYFGAAVTEPPLQLIIFNPLGIKSDGCIQNGLVGAGLAPAQGDRKGSPLQPDLNTPKSNVRGPEGDALHGLPGVESKPPGKGREVLDARELADEYLALRSACFVSQGSFNLRELGWFGHAPVIPEGECRITALALGKNNKVYGATSGERSHLFVYDPAADGVDIYARVIDLGIIGEQAKACRSLVVAKDGKVYGGTINANGEGGHLFMHDPKEEIELSFDSIEGWALPILPYPMEPGVQIVDSGLPVPEEGILTLTIDEERGRIYGLTQPSGLFFVYDIREGTTWIKGSLGRKNISRALICDGEGNVYGSREEGYLFKYDVTADEIINLDIQIPASKGRQYLNAVDSLVQADDGIIYGGTVADGFLFSFDPASERLINLGKPTRQARIRALTVGYDGRIYGVAGEENGIAHLFYYDPLTGDLTDLGIPRAVIPKEWTGLEFDSMVTGSNGEIFMGESDRISHLFIYYPPIRKVSP
jgi:outer membrane protein assembly factor BamB